VLRAPTPDGDVFFKANMRALSHEAGVVGVLAARRPDAVTPLLAADVDRGWLLMADAGTRLREAPEQRWDELLAL
jgi:hypothetical protein